MKTVLVVDDNEDARELLKMAFEPTWRVVTACDGEEGLEAAVREKPDVVVTDVSMPMMDGHQMVQALRERVGRVPTVACTGSDLNDGWDHFDLVITKPALPQDVLRAVEELLKLR